MKTLYVKDLQKNLVIVNETFVLVEADRSQDKNGNFYYNIVLGDKTGKIPAKIWSEKVDRIETKALKQGTVVQIGGKVEDYRGKLQVNIMDLNRVDESSLDEYLESSEFDAEEMMKELIDTIESIKSKSIKKVLTKIFDNEEIARKFKYWPAAASVHHDFRSGLLQHVLEMLRIAGSLIKFYPKINYDILKAGVILHDIGKLFELDASSNIAVVYSKEGTLMGHIVRGVLLLEEYDKGDLDSDTKLHLQHLILSHHGSLEYGSPVVPSTVEAVMLSQIDNLSAKGRIAAKVKKAISSDSEFSSNINWLEGAKIWTGGSTNEDLDTSKQLQLMN